jgi:serine/threonine protein kinase
MIGSNEDLTKDTPVTKTDPTPNTLSSSSDSGRIRKPELPRPFGDYDLLEEIARGGMGVIYKARQRGLDRMVALKMILGEGQASGLHLERFIREARAAAALDHPNIVPVYENGCQDGQPFFTMALIEGVSLQQQVKQNGTPEPREAVRLLRGILDAVAYAHARNIIHRDLKPHNILIDPQGRPRVTDFGLARRCEEGEALTGTGEVLGTPNYMAPEQALGQTAQIGPAADIYGLGGLLYFLLTGRPPFVGSSVLTLLRQVVDDPPQPPTSVNSKAPLGLQEICLKCLAKAPSDRYPSAAALEDALAHWEERWPTSQDKTTSVIPDTYAWRPRSRRPTALIGGAAALAVAAVVLALCLPRLRKEPAPPPNQDPPPVQARSDPDLPTELRRDFGLKVEMIGGKVAQDGMHVFNENDKVRFNVQVERDAYVGIWTIDAEGTIVQLFPNKEEPDHLVKAGQPRTIPGEKAVIDATATPAGQSEALRILASTRRWAPLEGEKQGPFVVLRTPEERQRFEKHLRSFKVRPKEAPVPQGDDAIAEEVFRYRVLPAQAAR